MPNSANWPCYHIKSGKYQTAAPDSPGRKTSNAAKDGATAAALPAGELAYQARIAPQTASLRLSKLVAGELLAVERRGRLRYYRLAGSEIGQALETLLALAPQTPLLRRQLAEPDGPIRMARTFYLNPQKNTPSMA